jgi:hypothetical protein
MSTTFPRREFTADDECRTVSDVHLVPSAVVLILPVRLNVVIHKYIVSLLFPDLTEDAGFEYIISVTMVKSYNNTAI